MLLGGLAKFKTLDFPQLISYTIDRINYVSNVQSEDKIATDDIITQINNYMNQYDFFKLLVFHKDGSITSQLDDVTKQSIKRFYNPREESTLVSPEDTMLEQKSPDILLFPHHMKRISMEDLTSTLNYQYLSSECKTRLEQLSPDDHYTQAIQIITNTYWKNCTTIIPEEFSIIQLKHALEQTYYYLSTLTTNNDHKRGIILKSLGIDQIKKMSHLYINENSGQKQIQDEQLNQFGTLCRVVQNYALYTVRRQLGFPDYFLIQYQEDRDSPTPETFRDLECALRTSRVYFLNTDQFLPIYIDIRYTHRTCKQSAVCLLLPCNNTSSASSYTESITWVKFWIDGALTSEQKCVPEFKKINSLIEKTFQIVGSDCFKIPQQLLSVDCWRNIQGSFDTGQIWSFILGITILRGYPQYKNQICKDHLLETICQTISNISEPEREKYFLNVIKLYQLICEYNYVILSTNTKEEDISYMNVDQFYPFIIKQIKDTRDKTKELIQDIKDYMEHNNLLKLIQVK